MHRYHTRRGQKRASDARLKEKAPGGGTPPGATLLLQRFSVCFEVAWHNSRYFQFPQACVEGRYVGGEQPVQVLKLLLHSSVQFIEYLVRLAGGSEVGASDSHVQKSQLLIQSSRYVGRRI